MQSNTNITIYNKYYDDIIRTDNYQKTVIKGVHFEENKAVIQNKGGLVVADKILIMIPFSAECEPQRKYEAQKKFAKAGDKTGLFTFGSADLIIKGLGPDFVSISQLQEDNEVYIITAVDTCDYGSSSLHHWEVSCR